MTMAEPAPIMIVAGEASGDLHGAALCRALRVLAPERASARDGRCSAWPPRVWTGWPMSPGRCGGRHGGPRSRCPRSSPPGGGCGPRCEGTASPRRARDHRLPGVQPAAGPRGPAGRRARRLLHPAPDLGVATVAGPCRRPPGLARAGGVPVRAAALPARGRARGVRRPSTARRAGRCAPRATRRAAGSASLPTRSVVGLLPGSRRQEIERTLPVLHAAAAAYRGRATGHAVRAGGGADARGRPRSGRIAGECRPAGPGRYAATPTPSCAPPTWCS